MTRWRQTALAMASLVVLTLGTSCGDGGDGADATPTTQATEAAPDASATPLVDLLPTPSPGTTEGWLTYENEEFGYAIEYPADAEVTEGFAQTVAVDDPGPGTLLKLALQEGTNLDESFVFITASEAPAAECMPPDQDGTVTISGIDFAHSRIAAGMAMHSWSGDGYMASNGKVCVTINAVLGSVSTSAFADPPAEFDRDAAQADLDAILSTFRWVD